MNTLAHSIPDARSLSGLIPPATLTEARHLRDALSGLLGREREACADFLLALADFDRRRGWERLGHASLFAFLTRELALSNGAAWLRLTAARLLPRYPAVEAALRQGRLCLSAVGELSRVLTEENAAEVLPRFFGRSSREAREVAAAIRPHPAPPQRTVVTRLDQPVAATAATAGRVGPTAQAAPTLAAALAPVPALGPAPAHSADADAPLLRAVPPALPLPEAATPLDPEPLRAHEVAPTHPAQGVRATVEPLTADLRRLHLTVPARLLEKVAAARDGLSHALPGATVEQVLEAALDLLLEQQARRKALVRRPRAAAPSPASPPAIEPAASAPVVAPAVASRHVPAAIEREVRLRDGDRCQYPLDAGGVCGATCRIQLDHVVPRALGGPTTAANLRCACAAHNRRAAEEVLGPAVAGVRRTSRRAR